MKQQTGGFVCVQTNDADHNEVVVFARRSGGELDRLGSYLTGGKGSGEPHLPSQSSLVLDGDRLFVTNAGSDDVTVFAAEGDKIVVLEAAGAQIGKASASSYKLGEPAKLAPVSGPVGSTRSEVCWAVISKDGRTVFVTNFGDGTISTYAIHADGSIALREAVAATTVDGTPGIRDEALSSDGEYLYALHADTGRVFGWKVGARGELAPVGSANGLPLTAAGLAAS